MGNQNGANSNNPAILTRYILAPAVKEYHVPLYQEMDITRFTEGPLPEMPLLKIVAVYRPTGRGPFSYYGRESWEFEYVGIRII